MCPGPGKRNDCLQMDELLHIKAIDAEARGLQISTEYEKGIVNSGH